VVFVQLREGEYFEGRVLEMSAEGIKVGFMGVLEGMIRPSGMHRNTGYDGQNNRWMFLQDKETGYVWNVGARVSFKVDKCGIT
jgi:DNA-directed RNA polymerase subunit E'/Rpb7